MNDFMHNSDFIKQGAPFDPKAHENGVALQTHKNAAHKGLYDPNCRACVELTNKMLQAKEQ